MEFLFFYKLFFYGEKGVRVGGWVVVGVQGKVAFWIKAFLYIMFLKKKA